MIIDNKTIIDDDKRTNYCDIIEECSGYTVTF